jgi:tRNA A37 threonylcarbamoyladenosine biosynthesis protein TsaE
MTSIKNPFPRKSVVTPEGGSGVPLYTLLTPQVERASRLAVEYLQDRIGQVITIQGPYGSGKSHLINFSMQQVQQTHNAMDPKPRVLQIYQRASSADFLSFYKELIKQIGFEMLQEVNDRFLGIVAVDEMKKSMEKSKEGLLGLLPDDKRKEIEAQYAEATKQRVESFRNDPKLIYTYLDNLVIQPETVYDQRGFELQQIAGENFKKAFFYLPDVRLGRTAYSWFVVDDMTNDDLARLGVSSRLTSALDAKYALSLLITLFNYAGIQLLIYLDQLEKLVLDTDPKTLDENRGVIQSLAELCPVQKAFLAVAGANDGWALMREDFWTRIGATKLQLGTISANWAYSLIKVYLREKEAYSLNTEAEEDIAPFTFGAVDEILKISNGNVRLFLQVCHEVFKQYASAGASSITPELVKNAVANQFDEGSVSAEIQRILTQNGLRFELQSKLNGDFRPDILIGDRTNPLAVVEISNSLFYLDEAEDAVDIVNQRAALTREHPNTRFIVVTIGYASDEVADQLNRVVDNYLVYDGQSFGKNFEAVLNSLSGAGTPPTPAVRATEVKDDLQEVLAAREQEISQLNERLQALAQAQTTKLPSRYQEWRSWLRADQEQWEKRQAELVARAEDQRKGLQIVGESERARSLVSWSFLYGIPILGAAVGLLYLRDRGLGPQVLFVFPLSYLLLFLAGFIAVAAFFYFRFIYLEYAPLLLETTEIGRYPGELGQLILRAKTARISRAQSRRCLRNVNPVIRYFGALTFLTRNEEVEQTEPSPVAAGGSAPDKVPPPVVGRVPIKWNELAVIEDWKPLYLLYLRLMFRSEKLPTIQEMLDLLIEANIGDPRIIYLLGMFPGEFRQGFDMNLTGLNAVSAAGEKTLAHAVFAFCLTQYGVWRNSSVSYSPVVQFAKAMTNVGSSEDRFSVLVNWYRDHGQFWHAELKEPVRLDLDEDELTSMINVLSPHRDMGLASFYDLPGHNFYLKLYRFFSEIEWRVAQGDVLLKQ